MEWNALPALAELVAALAVLATLVYLSLQIRNQNMVAAAQIHQQRADSTAHLVSLTLEADPSLEFFSRLLELEFQTTGPSMVLA